MKMSHEKPPVWEECKKQFTFGFGTVFTYGDVIYNPDKIEIPDHLMIHEEVHAKQQEHDEHVAAVWWKRYFADEKFRVEQELEAYGKQYAFICGKVKDRNARYWNLHIIAQDLSSAMYGNSISYTDAIRRIKESALSIKQNKHENQRRNNEAK